MKLEASGWSVLLVRFVSGRPGSEVCFAWTEMNRGVQEEHQMRLDELLLECNEEYDVDEEALEVPQDGARVKLRQIEQSSPCFGLSPLLSLTKPIEEPTAPRNSDSSATLPSKIKNVATDGLATTNKLGWGPRAEFAANWSSPSSAHERPTRSPLVTAIAGALEVGIGLPEVGHDHLITEHGLQPVERHADLVVQLAHLDQSRMRVATPSSRCSCMSVKHVFVSVSV